MVEDRTQDPRPPAKPERQVGKTVQDDYELALAEFREEENSHTADFFNLKNALRVITSYLDGWLLLNHQAGGEIRMKAEAFVRKVQQGIEAKVRWDGQPWAGLNADEVSMREKWEYAHNLLAAGLEP